MVFVCSCSTGHLVDTLYNLLKRFALNNFNIASEDYFLRYNPSASSKPLPFGVLWKGMRLLVDVRTSNCAPSTRG